MRLDVHSLVRYHALADVLRTRIMDGTYPAGSSLPTELKLAAQHGCCRDTVRDALDVLRQEGLIIKERGHRALITPAPDRSIVVLAPGSTVRARMPLRPELPHLGCRAETPILEVTSLRAGTLLHPADRVVLTVARVVA